MTIELSLRGLSVDAGSFGVDTASSTTFAVRSEDGMMIKLGLVTPMGGPSAAPTAPFGD